VQKIFLVEEPNYPRGGICHDKTPKNQSTIE
jgi:hypothetical protein